MKKFAPFLFAIAIILIALYFVVGGMLYHHKTYIDIHSGKMKFVRINFKYFVTEQVSENIVSIAAKNYGLITKQPEWALIGDREVGWMGSIARGHGKGSRGYTCTDDLIKIFDIYEVIKGKPLSENTQRECIESLIKAMETEDFNEIENKLNKIYDELKVPEK